MEDRKADPKTITSRIGIITAGVVALGLVATFGTATVLAQENGTKQMQVCVQAGGSYRTVSDNGECMVSH